MKKLTVLLLVVMASAISACQDSEPMHDVQYYLDHPKERAEKITECGNNPGEKAKEPNCINAFEAEYKAIFRKENEGMPKIR